MFLLEDALGLFGVGVVPVHVVVIEVRVEVGGGLGEERLVSSCLLGMKLKCFGVEHHPVRFVDLLSKLMSQHVRGLQLVQLVDEQGAHRAGGVLGVDLVVLCHWDLLM